MEARPSEATIGDWDAHRPTITRLWWEEDQTLEELRRVMSRDYAFQATPRQYRTRLKGWKLEKNFKESELATLAFHAHKIRATCPSQPVGSIRGRVVTLRRLQIAARRKRLTLQHLAAKAPTECPISVSLSAIPTSPVRIHDPDCYRGAEQTLGNIAAYIAHSLRARTWIIVRDDMQSFIFIHRMHSRHVNLAGFRYHFLMGLNQISAGQISKGFSFMHLASDYLRTLVTQKCPLMVQEVLLAASRAINQRVPELANLMLGFLIRASQQSRDRYLNEMFVRFPGLDHELLRDFTYQACLVCMRCLDDHADAKILPWQGNVSPKTLLTYLCSSVNPSLTMFVPGETLRIKFPG